MDEPVADVRILTDQDEIEAYLKRRAAEDITVIVKGTDVSDELIRRVDSLAAQALGEWPSEISNRERSQARPIDHRSSDAKLTVWLQQLALTKAQIERLNERIRQEVSELSSSKTLNRGESGADTICVVAREVGKRWAFPREDIDFIKSASDAGRVVRILLIFTDRNGNWLDEVAMEVARNEPLGPNVTRISLRNETVFFGNTRIFGWAICGNTEVDDIVVGPGGSDTMLLESSTTNTIVFEKWSFLWWIARQHMDPNQFWELHGGRTVTYVWRRTR
jgi:hypothetical protein